MILPRERGGWWHNYVCPTHHVELSPPAGDSFPCRHGCALRGEPYASAWAALAHQRAARRVRLLAQRADPTSMSLLDEYAGIYNELVLPGWNEQAQPWMLRGRLFAQALSEAQWAAQIADAVITCGRSANTRAVNTMLEGLIETVAEARRVLVEERHDLRNNYTAWLDCAGALVSRALGRSADVWRRRMADHIDVAIGDDGWEWEGSTYYHVFVLRAYLLNINGVRPVDVPAEVAERIVAMLRVLVSITAPDGSLPALHDSPNQRIGYLREIVEVCVLGRLFAPVPGLDQVESSARAELGSYDDGLEQYLGGWFAGPPLAIGAAEHPGVFPTAGLVVLRDPACDLVAVLDAGVAAENHGPHRHASQLALYLYGRDGAWQPAPGVPPYASRLRRDHYATPWAHPTIRVDDMAPLPAPAEVKLDDGRVVVETTCLYPGVDLRRCVEMTDSVLIDTLTARSADEHTFVLGLRPGDMISVAKGCSSPDADAVDVWRTTWEAGRQRLTGIHVADRPTTLEVLAGRGPADDPSRPHLIADWTCRGREVTFASIYRTQDLTEPDLAEMVTTAIGGSPTSTRPTS